MYHSINIESTERIEAFNTYSSFSGHLIPERRPLVKPPAVKKEYVNVPGANGSLDYTEALNGILYENRKGSWEFYVDNNYQDRDEGAWSIMYSELMRQLHGKYFDHIWLEDDVRNSDGLPDYYYRGRIFVNEWKSDPQFSKLVLDYELEPYKQPTPREGEVVADWLWNDLFGDKSVNPIRYNSFKVDGTKDRTIYGNSKITAFAHSSGMSVTLSDGSSVSLPVNESTQVTLTSDKEERITFTGYGTIDVSYGKGPEL